MPFVEDCPKWSTVKESAQYQSLSNDGREAMRDAYFSDCVAPHVPTSDLVAVRLDFYDRTSPSWFERMNTTELAVTVVGGILLVGIACWRAPKVDHLEGWVRVEF